MTDKRLEEFVLLISTKDLNRKIAVSHKITDLLLSVFVRHQSMVFQKQDYPTQRLELYIAQGFLVSRLEML